MLLPSKELISEVLNIELACKEYIANEIIRFDTKANEVVYFTKTMRWGDVAKRINIYELASKCKEWAKLKHFIDIDSHPGCARWGAKAVSHNGKPSVFYEQVFIGRTEPEAIFKACEYIMEQTK